MAFSNDPNLLSREVLSMNLGPMKISWECVSRINGTGP